MAKETHDEQLVQSAALRASIVGWLQSNQGDHYVRPIAEGIGAEYGRTAHALKMLAKGHVIKEHGAGLGRGHKISYSASSNQVMMDVETIAAGSKTRKVRVSKGKEIELVVSGVEVVIGRNPVTGRVRITLEG